MRPAKKEKAKKLEPTSHEHAKTSGRKSIW
jgi:hypothetical protein